MVTRYNRGYTLYQKIKHNPMYTSMSEIFKDVHAAWRDFMMREASDTSESSDTSDSDSSHTVEDAVSLSSDDSMDNESDISDDSTTTEE